MAIYLTRRRKWLAGIILAFGLLVVTFAALPGRTIDSNRLQSEYVKRLERYNGVAYVWGGENANGIDCSGLVRRGLIDAHRRIATQTLNPAALRTALDLWWHDCSALALRDQYRDYTTPVLSAKSINSVDHTKIKSGDIAVTSNGVHVLAYLGDKRWIEADPGLNEVVTLTVPSDNNWFDTPVEVMRWTHLANTPSPTPDLIQLAPQGQPN